jgi:hypothetical protein
MGPVTESWEAYVVHGLVDQVGLAAALGMPASTLRARRARGDATIEPPVGQLGGSAVWTVEQAHRMRATVVPRRRPGRPRRTLPYAP